MGAPADTDREETLAERQERFLGEAVGILTETEELDPLQRQRKLGLDEVRRIEDVLTALAQEYRDEDAMSRQSSRRTGDAAKQLADIEAACAALATAFDQAGQDAYNVLNGLGPAGSNFRTIAWGLPGSGESYAEGRRHFGALSTITGRYRLAYGPQEPAAEVLSGLLARGVASILPSERKQVRVRLRRAWRARSGRRVLRVSFKRLRWTVPGSPVFWPEAIAALGMMVGTLREDYELRFEQERRRLADVRDHGPRGSLPTSARNVAEAEKKLATKKPPRNDTGSRGGNQNLSHIMRGHPKWILTRECCNALDGLGYRSQDEISSAREGWFLRFVIKVYGVATGIDIEMSDGEGTDGLDKHARLVVHVGPRLRHLVMRSVGAMWPPLSELEREELGSLRQVWAEGRDFAWRD